MSQLPVGAPLNPDAAADDGLHDAAGTDEMLPSAADSSGLSPAVRQQLEQQVQAGGGADQLVADLRARIDEIDRRGLPEEGLERQRMQADRALLVAQVSYVEDHLASGVSRRSATHDASSGMGMSGTSGGDVSDTGLRGAHGDFSDTGVSGATNRADSDWTTGSSVGVTGGAAAGASTAGAAGSFGGPTGTGAGAGVSTVDDVAGVEERDRVRGAAGASATGRRRSRIYDAVR